MVMNRSVFVRGYTCLSSRGRLNLSDQIVEAGSFIFSPVPQLTVKRFPGLAVFFFLTQLQFCQMVQNDLCYPSLKSKLEATFPKKQLQFLNREQSRKLITAFASHSKSFHCKSRQRKALASALHSAVQINSRPVPHNKLHPRSLG